jgi:imidazolonepropionase-like amidohydrolase
MKPSLVASLLVSCAVSVDAATLLLKNATVHTVSGPVLTNAPVLVRDGRIASVGTAPATADKVVDLHGLQLFPGLITPTSVLGLQEIDALRQSKDTTEVGEFTPDVAAWIAVNPDSELIPVARAGGYTHVQVVPLGGIVSGSSAVIRLRGWTIEDLTVEPRCALHVRWPSFSIDTTPPETAGNKDSWKSVEDQNKDRDKVLRRIDEFFDQAQAYDEAKKAAGSGPFQVVPAWEAMLPFVRRERPVWVHADEVRQIRSAVGWLSRRKFSGVIAGGRDAWREASLLASNGVAVAYEHVFTQPPRDVDPYDVQFSAPAILTASGVTVAFTEGTDRFGASSIRNVPHSAAQARAFGLSHAEAVRGLTLYPARILGLADRLGSIESGREATLIALDGDVLDIRSNVRRMWIAGEEMDLSSRHTRLNDRYRSRPRPTP